ncbi:MAG: hypothetical protein L5656_02710 [Thermanaeromonas sp.]|uniref:hypothetical protein n=1 Tax=Thermanaeromonas sp. TaxID=2003697 RepID=UPI00243C3D46|nr:hypothetical protein [Thermanaeromonas sp.]MCG0277430.1 hypothetical protein [Thermanaeromonas sp.]
MALAAWYLVIAFLFMVMFWNFTFVFRSEKLKSCLLLLVKDQEEIIEGILRFILWWRSLTGYWLEVVVVDCGSTDDTPRILERFNFPYPVCRVEGIFEGKGKEKAGFSDCLRGSYEFFTWDLRGLASGRLPFKQISTCMGKNIKFKKERGRE